jgi:3'5'-cyclic nucleotide phosphodiesterase
LDEVKEVISLPKFDSQTAKKVANLRDVTISDQAILQLRKYVTEIARRYHNNAFHNFEHASHVAMAMHKLMSRVVTPEKVNYQGRNVSKIKSDLHYYTFGLTSDPLSHFAVVLSALVHDVDHTGVSNAQLATERPDLAKRYRNQSLAEQNSVDLSWNLLMGTEYVCGLASLYFLQSNRAFAISTSHCQFGPGD